VTLVDANILLYAYNADAPEHAPSAAWLERALAGPETIALPLLVVWAFLRLSTNPRVWPSPKTAAEAFGIMKELLALPGVVLLQPGSRHIEILEALVTTYKATGPLMTDAVLAAMALESGATLASTDRDFSRFENLRWINPLAEPAR
jgi:hypothetical protein